MSISRSEQDRPTAKGSTIRTGITRDQRHADLRDMDPDALKTTCESHGVEYVNKKHAVIAVLNLEFPTETQRLTEPTARGATDHFRERRPRRL